MLFTDLRVFDPVTCGQIHTKVYIHNENIINAQKLAYICFVS